MPIRKAVKGAAMFVTNKYCIMEGDCNSLYPIPKQILLTWNIEPTRIPSLLMQYG